MDLSINTNKFWENRVKILFKIMKLQMILKIYQKKLKKIKKSKFKVCKKLSAMKKTIIKINQHPYMIKNHLLTQMF